MKLREEEKCQKRSNQGQEERKQGEETNLGDAVCMRGCD